MAETSLTIKLVDESGSEQQRPAPPNMGQAGREGPPRQTPPAPTQQQGQQQQHHQQHHQPPRSTVGAAGQEREQVRGATEPAQGQQGQETPRAKAGEAAKERPAPEEPKAAEPQRSQPGTAAKERENTRPQPRDNTEQGKATALADHAGGRGRRKPAPKRPKKDGEPEFLKLLNAVGTASDALGLRGLAGSAGEISGRISGILKAADAIQGLFKPAEAEAEPPPENRPQPETEKPQPGEAKQAAESLRDVGEAAKEAAKGLREVGAAKPESPEPPQSEPPRSEPSEPGEAGRQRDATKRPPDDDIEELVDADEAPQPQEPGEAARERQRVQFEDEHLELLEDDDDFPAQPRNAGEARRERPAARDDDDIEVLESDDDFPEPPRNAGEAGRERRPAPDDIEELVDADEPPRPKEPGSARRQVDPSRIKPQTADDVIHRVPPQPAKPGAAASEFQALARQAPTTPTVTTSRAGTAAAGRAATKAAGKAALGTAGRAAGTAAAGKAAGAAAAAMSGVAAAAVPLGVALGGLTLGAGAAALAVRKFDFEANRLKGFSSQLGEAAALADARRQMGDLRRAQEIGPELARFQTTRSKFEEKLSDLGTEILELLVNLGNQFEPAIDATGKIVEVLSALFDVTNNGLSFIIGNTNIKPLMSIVKTIADLIEDIAMSIPPVRKAIEESRRKNALNEEEFNRQFFQAGGRQMDEDRRHPLDLPMGEMLP